MGIEYLPPLAFLEPQSSETNVCFESIINLMGTKTKKTPPKHSKYKLCVSYGTCDEMTKNSPQRQGGLMLQAPSTSQCICILFCISF